jgi:heme-degrading monooxygenase HmoA
MLMAVVATVACGRSSGTTESHGGGQAVVFDPHVNPNVQVRIDAFSVPDASRSEFEAAMHANAAFLGTLPGFQGHTVFEKAAGPTTFNVVTIAAWESAEAMKNAGQKVQEHYRDIGFDMPGAIARWGVTASIGSYRVAAE